MANFADATEDSVSLVRSGHGRYKAPEIFEASAGNGKIRHTEFSDVFSLGMLMWHVSVPRTPPGGRAYSWPALFLDQFWSQALQRGA